MFNKISSFFAQLRFNSFKRRTNHEIYDRIFPHLEHERNHGYAFGTDAEMSTETARLDVKPALDRIEGHIRNMPDAYGQAFRHIMHRDLHERFRTYEQLARREMQPQTCDPKFIATRLEPAR